mmetsp:Transcript_128573/g.372057  ORF Transcript_128573/g.372057 Transcript_128573/m.372057 type:complete len:214 (+) Transcript_128573:73-714(+)
MAGLEVAGAPRWVRIAPQPLRCAAPQPSLPTWRPAGGPALSGGEGAPAYKILQSNGAGAMRYVDTSPAGIAQETTYRFTTLGVSDMDAPAKGGSVATIVRTIFSLGLIVSVLVLVVIMLPPPRSYAPRTLPYDCVAGVSGAAEQWSREKQDWCCSTLGEGCPPLQPQPPSAPEVELVLAESYNCDMGWANWETTWRSEKKVWCCNHARRGCSK